MSGQDCIPPMGFFGQTFTAYDLGEWQQLTFNISSMTGTGAANVFIAEGEIADKTLATVEMVGTVTAAGAQTFPISRQVEVGKKYIWWVEAPASITRICYDVTSNVVGNRNDYVHADRVSAVLGGDPQAGSGMIGGANAPAGIGGQSVAFSIFIFAPPIPTLSEWGLLITGLLVLNLGLFFVRKKENILV